MNKITPEPHNTKRLYVKISLIIGSFLIIAILSAYYLHIQSRTRQSSYPPAAQQVTPEPYLDKTKNTNSKKPSPTLSEKWIMYKFAHYPVSFQYPINLTLKENDNPSAVSAVVELYYEENKIITIQPEQRGIDFENPDLDITADRLYHNDYYLF